MLGFLFSEDNIVKTSQSVPETFEVKTMYTVNKFVADIGSLGPSV